LLNHLYQQNLSIWSPFRVWTWSAGNRCHGKYPSFLSDFNETWTFWKEFWKTLVYQFYENPSIVSRDVPCGQPDVQTVMTKLIAILLNFSKTSKINYVFGNLFCLCA